MIDGYKKDSRALLLGDERLYKKSEPVQKSDIDMIPPIVEEMHEILIAYQEEYGKFRAIAAPQIDIRERIIYVCLDTSMVIINPVLKNKSKEMMDVWDDCMSFPDLLVKVKRHQHCTPEYLDIHWERCRLDLQDDMSELFQHEYDHLDGILATQRAIDGQSFAIFKK